MEYRHHGDLFVGRQERYSGFARALFAAFGLPIENQWALNTAKVAGTNKQSLVIAEDLDTPGLLRGVKTIGAHAHFPLTLAVTDDAAGVRVLAKQRINPEAPPHPG